MRLAVIGAGNWGTTLAVVYARLGHVVALWDRDPERVRAMRESRENARYLPGVPLPEALRVTSDLAAAVHECALVVLAVPAQAVREMAAQLCPYLPSGPRQGAQTIVVIAAKGLELGTGLRMSEVVAQSLRPRQRRRVAVLSGPNLAGEIVRGLPAASVAAARYRPTAALAQHLLATPRWRFYVSSDVTGVELGGALKNVMALVAGLAEGLGYGDNGKASIMTRGLAEIARLGVAAGARHATFAGLSGLGDLIATCASPLSRNHYVGYELGRGRSLDEIQSGMASVAEGITTTRAALELARRYRVEMPITEQLHTVLFAGKNPHAAVDDLLARAARDELTSQPLPRVDERGLARAADGALLAQQG
jgi:glycerol-3-phosphate dehydrogenase (NAD(P)+)